MPTDPAPTPEDMARDLAWDLELVGRGERNEYSDQGPNAAPWCWRDTVLRDVWIGWPAAIRRALAAERDRDRLAAEVERLREEDANLRGRLAASMERELELRAALAASRPLEHVCDGGFTMTGAMLLGWAWPGCSAGCPGCESERLRVAAGKGEG